MYNNISFKQRQGNSRLASGIKFTTAPYNYGFTAQTVSQVIPESVMRIDSTGGLGIGTTTPSGNLSINEYIQWREISELAETNPAVKIALEKLITVYHLSKDHGDDKT